LFRGYYGISQENYETELPNANSNVSKYRKDMEEGTFFVDNTGGALYGRGMYFAYANPKKKFERELAFAAAKSYGTAGMLDIEAETKNALLDNNGVRMDKATLDPSAKIMTINELDEAYENELFKIYFNKKEKEMLEPIANIDSRITKLRRMLYDNLSAEDEEKEKMLREQMEQYERIRATKRSEIDEEIYQRYDNLTSITSEADTGVKATMLGIDGYIVSEKNYFVLLNRSKLVLLDDEGDFIDNIDKLDI
jgi:hypothetical protein